MKLTPVLFLSCLISVLYFKEQRTFLDFTSIIKHVNSAQKSWTAGHNKYFDGMSLQEIKHLMGSLETPQHLRLPQLNIQPANDIPEEFFSADEWPNCQSIKDIRDQSMCGSCWAFGTVQTISDRICIASGQKIQVRISAQDLNSCCGITCGGCNGGMTSSAFNYWKSTGIVTGWLYNTTGWCQPYTFPECDHHTTGKYSPCGGVKPTPQCKKSCMQSYQGSYEVDRWIAQSVYSVPSQVSKIQTEIMTNGPVEASFTVYGDFPTYKSGVYHHISGAPLGGHAVKIVGWGVQNQTPYWLVANSWNEDWGDKGFFKIRRWNNECGIEGQVVAGIPKLK